KLTDHASKMNVSIRSYPATGQTVHLLNRNRLDELYKLDKPRKRTVSLTYLSNQIVHSYVFSLLFDEDGQLAGILVSSDRDRSKELLEVPIQKIIKVFEKVGK